MNRGNVKRNIKTDLNEICFSTVDWIKKRGVGPGCAKRSGYIHGSLHN